MLNALVMGVTACAAVAHNGVDKVGGLFRGCLLPEEEDAQGGGDRGPCLRPPRDVHRRRVHRHAEGRQQPGKLLKWYLSVIDIRTSSSVCNATVACLELDCPTPGKLMYLQSSKCAQLPCTLHARYEPFKYFLLNGQQVNCQALVCAPSMLADWSASAAGQSAWRRL